MGTVTLKHDVTNESVADPSVDIMDAGMEDDNPTTNSGSLFQLFAGKSSCDEKGCVENENLHYFDMAQVVPKSAIITAAEWWVYIESYSIDMGDDGIAVFYAQRIRRNGVNGNTVWVESEATWNNYDTGNTWTTPGAKHPADDRDTVISLILTSLDTGDSGLGVSVTVTNTTLKDTDKTWSADLWNGFTVQCAGKTMLITDTYLDGSDWVVSGDGWSGGGNPGNGNPYVITDIGWWNPSILVIVKDAHENHEGKVHFVVGRLDLINTSGWIQYWTKDASTPYTARRPHLRVTYEMGVPTDSGANTAEGAVFAAGDTTLTVTDSNPFAISHFIKLEDELLQITAIPDGTTLTVTRGEGSTADVDHPDPTDIYLWDFATFQAMVY